MYIREGHFSLTGVFFQWFRGDHCFHYLGSFGGEGKALAFFYFHFDSDCFHLPYSRGMDLGKRVASTDGIQGFCRFFHRSFRRWLGGTGGDSFVGPRSGKYKKNGKVNPTPASNVTLVTLGTFILWLGWIGFNGGSVLALDSTLNAATMGLVIFNTNMAAVGGVIVALFLECLFIKRYRYCGS